MTFPEQPGTWQDPTQPTPPTYPPVSPVQSGGDTTPYPTYPVTNPVQSGDTEPYTAYPPPQVQGYPGYAGYGQPMAAAPTNGMAIAALVCALAVITAPIGAILGHVARRQIRQTGEQGDGLALAGIIVGWAFTAIGVVCCGGYLIVILGLFASTGSYNSLGG